MKQLYEHLLTRASMTVIHLLCERALPGATPDQETHLRGIMEADSLDEAHARISEAMGDPTAAETIRAQRAGRLARTQPMDPELATMLGMT